MVRLPFPEVRSRPPPRFALPFRPAPVVVALAVLAVHGRSIAFGFTGTDDRDLILEDQAFLVLPSSLWRVFARSYMHVVDATHAYYRPLVTLSYALDARWSGVDPRGYHATNVALYGIASVLVLALLRSVVPGRATAFAGALLFAVHPALTPAVAWIPGRNDTLLAVFALASWLAFARDAAQPSAWHKVAHLVFFAMALLTKEVAVVLPAVCIAHVVLAQPDDWARLRRSRALAGFALAWAAIIAARVAAHPPGPGWAPSPRDLIANLPLFVAALGKVILPVHLSVLAAAADVPLWPGVVAAIAIGLSTRLVPGARVRIVALGAVAFLLFLAPAFALPGSLVLDQRLVLPACGALVAVAEIARAAEVERGVMIAAVSAVAAAFAAITFAFEGAFRDPMAFAREAVEGSPRSPLAHFCLGREYQERGDDDRALSEYRAALALGPADVVHNNIAVIAMRRGDWEEAEAELGLEIATHPGYGKAHYNLGIVLRHEGRMGEACDAERQAAKEAPDDAAFRRELERDCGR